MKILKSNTKEVFDTESITSVEVYHGNKPDISRSLHLNHESTDYEFLQQYFSLDHPIFKDFSKSFYYIIY